MRRICSSLAVLAIVLSPVASAKTGNAVAAAIASPDRPAEDVARDADRKPFELVTFELVTFEVEGSVTVCEPVPGAGSADR